GLFAVAYSAGSVPHSRPRRKSLHLTDAILLFRRLGVDVHSFVQSTIEEVRRQPKDSCEDSHCRPPQDFAESAPAFISSHAEPIQIQICAHLLFRLAQNSISSSWPGICQKGGAAWRRGQNRE